MRDLKNIGDSRITKRQKRRGRKPSRSDLFAWLLIGISVVYVIGHIIIWGGKL